MNEPSESTAAKTVLIVDDEALFCVLVSGLLEIQGYRSLVATNGAAALKLAQDPGQKIDAVLVDLTMRPMNGRQILRELRLRCPGMPVVMMSGSEKEDVAEMAAGTGDFPAYLQKPFSSEALAQAIRLASTAGTASPAR